MYDYYYRDAEENELGFQAINDRVAVRATEIFIDETSALVYLPLEEVDRMIASLQKVKQKIVDYQSRKM